jgi:hypothetical protein
MIKIGIVDEEGLYDEFGSFVGGPRESYDKCIKECSIRYNHDKEDVKEAIRESVSLIFSNRKSSIERLDKPKGGRNYVWFQYGQRQTQIYSVFHKTKWNDFIVVFSTITDKMKLTLKKEYPIIEQNCFSIEDMLFPLALSPYFPRYTIRDEIQVETNQILRYDDPVCKWYFFKPGDVVSLILKDSNGNVLEDTSHEKQMIIRNVIGPKLTGEGNQIFIK